ncbi:uncharacterized protein MONBRDRAFT_28647 [Monosiga brevicollis MX1]|uniref:DNA-(apurinic or apyrimidinic site) lyase n=1 Tax=Monosiga brevicollis TaxID=81824 RepID=A9V8S3_MONBE|nr:uncharacterized protein MONBRDRAFT_28647 [Monosiga brevicollis MX1]EDQ86011.1 predicted protein [Monosiga brevicollis MX1]|eukprot:XP_001749205.1 hypothetical protein [Monosiga brevicollis MX1]
MGNKPPVQPTATAKARWWGDSDKKAVLARVNMRELMLLMRSNHMYTLHRGGSVKWKPPAAEGSWVGLPTTIKVKQDAFERRVSSLEPGTKTQGACDETAHGEIYCNNVCIYNMFFQGNRIYFLSYKKRRDNNFFSCDIKCNPNLTSKMTSCHRVAAAHRRRLLKKRFVCTSPNGRFVEGARAIDGQPLSRIEVHGKNLFYFFGPRPEAANVAIVHVHFGMSGRFAVFDLDKAPEPTATTRLRLVNEQAGLVAHLSAMTVRLLDLAGYKAKARELGEDPLRSDAQPSVLWPRVKASRKSIGALLMDQGVGNIYRAEILFKSGVHPEIPAALLEEEQFETIWRHAVLLLQRGFEVGSILTVDPEEARRLGRPKMRRYIYNQKHCGRCRGPVRSWIINARTCYACPTCQPLTEGVSDTVAQVLERAKSPTVFTSHCAPDTLEERRCQPTKLRVAELRAELERLGHAVTGTKAVLVERLTSVMHQQPKTSKAAAASKPASRRRARQKRVKSQSETKAPIAGVAAKLPRPGTAHLKQMRSAAAAARDKRAVGEKQSVEHVADLDQTLAGATVDWTDLHGQDNPGVSLQRELTPNMGDAVVLVTQTGSRRSHRRLFPQADDQPVAAVERQSTVPLIPESGQEAELYVPRRLTRAAAKRAKISLAA